jgi:hypothetical protein
MPLRKTHPGPIIVLSIHLCFAPLLTCELVLFNAKSAEHLRNGSTGQKLSETTIRNESEKDVRYTIQLLRPGEKTWRKILQPGGADRFPGDVALVLTFQRGIKKITYRLNPGVSYSFRRDKSNELDVFSGGGIKSDTETPVPFVATPMDVVRKMLEMARVDKDDILYDLGCGDGRIVITAAKEYGARGVGIDIDPRRIEESVANARTAEVEDRVEFRLQDAEKAFFSDATVVTLYMLTEINERLRPALERQLRCGVYIVSHNYPILGWGCKLVEFVTMMAEDNDEHFIYLYRR